MKKTSEWKRELIVRLRGEKTTTTEPTTNEWRIELTERRMDETTRKRTRTNGL